jgi:hypothetical protein
VYLKFTPTPTLTTSLSYRCGHQSPGHKQYAIHPVTCRHRANNRTNACRLPVLSQDAAVKMHARLMRSCTPTFSTRTLRSVSPGIPSYKTMYFATSFLTISSTASETWITIVERCRRASGPSTPKSFRRPGIVRYLFPRRYTSYPPTLQL